MCLVQGFFALFSVLKKKCEVGFALESEGARQWQPIHAGCSAGGRALAGLHRVGAAQGTPRWPVFVLEHVLTVRQAPAGVEVVWYGEKDEEGGIW